MPLKFISIFCMSTVHAYDHHHSCGFNMRSMIYFLDKGEYTIFNFEAYINASADKQSGRHRFGHLSKYDTSTDIHFGNHYKIELELFPSL